MEVEPLAGESLGVRSFCVRISVDDTTVLIDPGTGLQNVRNKRPHPFEYQALQTTTNRIDQAAKTADAVVVTHYHYDHFVPLDTDHYLKLSRPERSRGVFEDTHVFVKHPDEHINTSQSNRARQLRPVFDGVADKLTLADGKTAELGPITLQFSPPVYHGRRGTDLGWVIMVAVEGPEETVVYTSDVGGPIDHECVTWIGEQDPDLVLVDGPLLNATWKPRSEDDIAAAQANLRQLAKSADLIIDHHPFRVRPNHRSPFLEPIKTAAAESGHEIFSVASYRGDPVRPLEAWREVIFKHFPPDPVFYDRVTSGEFVDKHVKWQDMFSKLPPDAG